MSPEIKPYCFLVVEDNPGDYILLKEYLKLSQLPIDKIVHADSLKFVPFLIKENVFDIVLLDLTLPDSNGVDSVITLGRLLPQTPIIVLSGLSTIEIAVESISLGAQDYLMKGEFDEKLLAKSIQYSIERKKTTEILRESNERYEMVNLATNDVIWEWDYATNNGLWGSGLIKNFGYSKDDLIKKDTWANQYLHPDDISKIKEKIAFTLERRIENWEEEFRFRCADGSYKDILDRGFILYNEDGTPQKMYGAMTDITASRKLEKALTEQKLFQQKLITEITIDTQENERGMLGRELHDNINQILAAAKIYIGMAKAGEGNSQELIDDSFKLVDNAMEEIRKLSKTLVAPSLGDIGLKEALEELVEEINITATTYFQLEYKSKKKADKKIELMIYRIVQEQMNNILKHAKAKEAGIKIDIEKNRLFLLITDNGVGFDPEIKSTGIGMRNIKSRIEFYSGKVTIISSPGNGCALKAEVPL
jgi:two-component system, NarL family, sensor histidine kinase UhpB